MLAALAGVGRSWGIRREYHRRRVVSFLIFVSSWHGWRGCVGCSFVVCSDGLVFGVWA